MNWIEAVLLGILQGLTEFLPVSSSGHLELGKAFLGIDPTHSLLFTVVVHGATVLSTIVVFRKDLYTLFRGALQFRWNEESRYVMLLLVSMLPVLVVGLFLKEEVEGFFSGRVRFVGSMLMVTALLLGASALFPRREGNIGFLDALIIGLAQAVAVLPGISRSGATIATGLMLGKDRGATARFSFLMVLLPIIGANILDLKDLPVSSGDTPQLMTLVAGFLSAFITGWLACRWMIRLVQKGRMAYFAAYCLLLGLLAITLG